MIKGLIAYKDFKDHLVTNCNIFIFQKESEKQEVVKEKKKLT